MTDYDGPISYYQYGMYTQAKKDFGKLTLTGSVRYDKSEFFDAVFTPRLELFTTFRITKIFVYPTRQDSETQPTKTST